MKKALITLFICSSSLMGMACSCLVYTSFCETMTPSTNVLGVRVLQSYLVDQGGGLDYQFIDVEVLDEIQGSAPTDTLSFLMANGTSCGPVADIFAYQVGDTLIVMANAPIDAEPHGHTSFRLDAGCSTVFLAVTRGTVDYEEFAANIDQCALLTKTLDKEQLIRLVHVFPNPAVDELNIYVDVLLEMDIQVFNAIGQRVYQQELLDRGKLGIDVRDWAMGVYYIRLEAENVVLVHKMVKVAS